MSWTYGGDPAANDRDKLRFLIGDTDTNDQLITDEEIAWLNTEYGSPIAAAADAALAIAAKLSRQADKEVGDLRVRLSQKAESFRAHAEILRVRAVQVGSESSSVPTNISLVSAFAATDDTAIFSIGMHDQAGTNPPWISDDG